MDRETFLLATFCLLCVFVVVHFVYLWYRDKTVAGLIAATTAALTKTMLAELDKRFTIELEKMNDKANVKRSPRLDS